MLAAYGIGIKKAVFMPDTFTMGYSVQYQLEDDKMPCCEIEVLDFDFEATMADTVQAAAMMEELDIGCVVVLGGDGTSRAAAKSLKKTPMLSISTGTNNLSNINCSSARFFRISTPICNPFSFWCICK